MPRKVPVGPLFMNTLKALQLQVEFLGESLSGTEILTYVEGPGPTSGYVHDGGARNPLRSKAWHLGRVKFFVEEFRAGRPVEPIDLLFDQGYGWIVSDGAHRLIAAALVPLTEIDAS